MVRYPFALKIKPESSGIFRRNLGILWPELTSFLDEQEISNVSLWNVSNLVFGYGEGKKEGYGEIEAFLKNHDLVCGKTFTWIAMPSSPMRLMYHDYGILRVKKDLIRHRVFITKLKEGMEEEYKRRHDALIHARNGAVTKGPDSNFTIWNAGGYIFGYDEIDTTMEHDMTEEEKDAVIKWEKKMLEIMTWETDDVDWITGESHPHIVKLASYK